MERITGGPMVLSPVRSPWRPAPIVLVSLALHIGGVFAFAIRPGEWLWILLLLVFNHVVLGALVFAPRGSLLGSNIVRLPPAAAARGEVSLTFDDGPDPQVTPRVLELLDKHGAHGSFFCVGEKAARFPELVAAMARRGHSVENHSQRHSSAFAFFGLSRLRRDIENTQAVLSRITGRRPEFFRAPAGFRSVLLDPVLASCALRYVSWTRRGFDSVSKDSRRVFDRLARGLRGGDILLLHDGTRGGAGEPVMLAVLPRVLDELKRRGLKSVPLPEAFRDG